MNKSSPLSKFIPGAGPASLRIIIFRDDMNYTISNFFCSRNQWESCPARIKIPNKLGRSWKLAVGWWCNPKYNTEYKIHFYLSPPFIPPPSLLSTTTKVERHKNVERAKILPFGWGLRERVEVDKIFYT